MALLLPRVPWEDLLGVPYLPNGDDPAEGLDCWGVAREVARRAGLAFPAIDGRFESGTTIPTGATAAGIGLAFALAAERWSLGGVLQVGDLFLSDPNARGYVSHVETVVDGVRQLVLSTGKAGPYCWPAWRGRCDRGIWRLRV